MSKQTFLIPNQSAQRAVMLDVWNLVSTLTADERQGVKIIVQTASTRSLDQNSRMWAMLADIAEQVSWHGTKLTPVEWKDVFSASLKRQKAVPGLDGGFVVVGGRTSEMSIREMGDLQELMEAFGAEHGVRFSAPAYLSEEAA